ncbi:alkanesulfonate monooxygenase SsuD/methylene tetrahydromethanopterin reductase-like flavin-dependent oxidoreductase (luciferase family) [Mycolicibacterium iranicum]|uniref:Alkanesulfonate monooxygenase SsuD/methylene tetrahydromethanopterin reductase-like flavin-dependent oxidoreductase (Luciferase family) n=1 Tax=Mycolicibacterium iranicum TaxID=912594 RepID=A0A839Q1Q4_MYCIR|nr:LLM class flavin-dependent oxidoreductase [Mycolicibacterium iranicum]MBB2989749.1 alkanesulfonate monooxygenase SsuD/methylene tetrahydromethanopterin reductase-like flavin-dependent oxidoreductase (luciferase family) [Mycolicibacterium iranicum]
MMQPPEHRPTPAGPEYGIFFRLNDTEADPVRQYHDGLDLIVHAEELGLATAWITSHHFRSDKGTIASPLVFLAAASQRTTRIRLGAGVVVITLENPIRVAEDAVIADALSGGRLQLGLGSGLEDWAFGPFGVDWDDRLRVYADKAAQLRSVLDGTDLGGGRRLYPPAGTLRQRLWRVASDPEHAGEIGKVGDNLLLRSSKALTFEGNLVRHSEAIDAFRSNAGPRQRIAASRTVIVAETVAEARKLAGQHAIDLHVKNGNGEPWYGDPELVQDRLLNDPELAHVDEVLLQVAPAKLTLSQWKSSLSLTMSEVLDPVRTKGRAYARVS